MIPADARAHLLLFPLNRRLFIENLRLAAWMIPVGLLFVFGGGAKLDLTASKGVYVLVGFLFLSLAESQILRTHSAGLLFYLRLPIRRSAALASYYTGTLLPACALLVLSYLAMRLLLVRTGITISEHVAGHRFLQVLCAVFFVRSLTVNLLIAMRIHAALIAAYFVLLGGVYIYLRWLQEVLAPAYLFGDTVLVALFLLATYLISFLAIQKVGI